jgi:hypothetical protein
MTWLNRGFKIRHKFTKEKEMKAEAIRALELFKQQHLARPAVEATDGQADMVSESPEPTKENQMEQRNIGIEALRYPPREVEVREADTSSRVPKKQKGVNFNYPDHYKPLKNRIMSALNNGARTAESVASYCKEDTKLINLQLGRWVSRGMIGRKVSESGIIRFYPQDIAKEMGILETPKKINYYTKERRAEDKKRSSSSAKPVQPTQAEAFVLRGETVGLSDKSNAKEAQYIEFLEKRIVEWQTECRKMAKEATDLKAKLSESEMKIIEARNAPRNVTGEVEEVMKEVMELRATVAYLESKLFGRK